MTPEEKAIFEKMVKSINKIIQSKVVADQYWFDLADLSDYIAEFISRNKGE